MRYSQGRPHGSLHLEPQHRPETDGPWYRSQRARLFALVGGITLALGVVWTLLQTPVYRSSATVLMSAPRAVDAAISEADVQNVAIQRTILLGGDITGRLWPTSGMNRASTLPWSIFVMCFGWSPCLRPTWCRWRPREKRATYSRRWSIPGSIC